MVTSLVPLHNQQLADFAPGQSAVKEMVARLKAGIKAKDATDAEYVALATLSMAHNLDPFNGEAWIIPGNGVMVGIKGLRKAADSQLPDYAFKNPNPRMLQHTEYEDYGVVGDVLMAAICELTRSDATQQWVDQLTQLTQVTGKYEEALKLLPPRPVWIGVGIVYKGEKSKMPLGQLVRKRAEADALKRAFNLPFNIDLSRENGDNGNGYEGGAVPDYVEGETITKPQPEPQPEPEIAKLTRPYDAETVRKGILSRVEHNPTGHAKAASTKQQGYVASLLAAAFKDSPTADKDRHAVQQYIIGKASTKDFSAAEANAFVEWLADETGDLSPDGWQEAQNVLRAALVAEGQMELFGEQEREVAK